MEQDASRNEPMGGGYSSRWYRSSCIEGWHRYLESYIRVNPFMFFFTPATLGLVIIYFGYIYDTPGSLHPSYYEEMTSNPFLILLLATGSVFIPIFLETLFNLRMYLTFPETGPESDKLELGARYRHEYDSFVAVTATVALLSLTYCALYITWFFIMNGDPGESISLTYVFSGHVLWMMFTSTCFRYLFHKMKPTVFDGTRSILCICLVVLFLLIQTARFFESDVTKSRLLTAFGYIVLLIIIIVLFLQAYDFFVYISNKYGLTTWRSHIKQFFQMDSDRPMEEIDLNSIHYKSGIDPLPSMTEGVNDSIQEEHSGEGEEDSGKRDSSVPIMSPVDSALYNLVAMSFLNLIAIVVTSKPSLSVDSSDPMKLTKRLIVSSLYIFTFIIIIRSFLNKSLLIRGREYRDKPKRDYVGKQLLLKFLPVAAIDNILSRRNAALRKKQQQHGLTSPDSPSSAYRVSDRPGKGEQEMVMYFNDIDGISNLSDTIIGECMSLVQPEITPTSVIYRFNCDLIEKAILEREYSNTVI